MTYVVTESWINCKHTDCAEVCPVEAIFAEDDVPEGQQDFIRLNAEVTKVWAPITAKKPGPADVDHWAQIKDKRALLEFA
jgi:ferredoxin